MSDLRSKTVSTSKLSRADSAAVSWPRLAALCGALLAAAAAASAQAPAGPPEDAAAPPADAERTASGLATKLLAAGFADQPPDANDVVKVQFTGWTPQGVKIHSSYDQDEPAVFNLQSVFPGWAEAMQMMVRGEKRRFWIPRRLGPQNPADGPEGDSVFDVEMIDILRIPNAPEMPQVSSENVARTPSGAVTELVTAGTGEEHPGPEAAVLVHYYGWTTDSKVFDSSILRQRPTLFPLDKVMPAFAEAVQMMVAGETRRVWIPENLARGEWAESPKGMLIFEIRLLDILPKGSLRPGKPELEADPAAGAEPPGSG